MPAKKSTRKTPKKKLTNKFRPGKDRISGYGTKYGSRFGDRKGSGGELKYHDATFTSSPVSLSSQWILMDSCLVKIKKGDGPNERIGRRVTITDIYYKVRLRPTPETVAAADPLTAGHPKVGGYMIILDKQCNQAFTTPAMVFEDAAQPLSMNNMTNTQRFHTYKRHLQTMQPAGAGVFTDVSEFVAIPLEGFLDEGHIKCNITVTYDNTAGAVDHTNVMTNNLVLMAVSPDATDLLDFRLRLRYKDC